MRVVVKTKIPTVEELRALAAARETAHAIGRSQHLQPPVVLVRDERAMEDRKRAELLEHRASELTNKVEELTKKLELGARRTPDELRETLLTLFERDQFSPAEELYRLYQEEYEGEGGKKFKTLSPEQRIKVLGELCSYVMPKLKSVEVKGTVKHSHKIVIQRWGSDGTVRTEEMEAHGSGTRELPQRIVDITAE